MEQAGSKGMSVWGKKASFTSRQSAELRLYYQTKTFRFFLGFLLRSCVEGVVLPI